MKGLSACFIINRFLRVENSLQMVDLCFNAAGKAISMPSVWKIYAGGGNFPLYRYRQRPDPGFWVKAGTRLVPGGLPVGLRKDGL